jgi:hypothetical protein
MKIEDQVCSFKQAKKLAELGIDLPTMYRWQVDQSRGDGESSPKLVLSAKSGKKDSAKDYPAPTVAELGLLLPTVINLDEEDLYLQGTIGNRRGEFYYIWFQSSLSNGEWEIFPSIEQETEAMARADALIWLIENDYVDVAELAL